MIKFCLSLSLIIFTIKPVLADRSFALKASANTNGALMASPPLPNLFGKKGDGSVSIRGAIFESSGTEGDQGGGSEFSGTVDFSGNAGALLYHHYLNDTFGFYLIGSANQFSGDFSSNSGGTEVEAKNAKSEFIQAGAGLSIRMFSGSFLPIQIFAGPSVVKTTVEQSITSSNGDDFDQTLDATVLTYMAGIQASLKLTNWFAINPYFVTTDFVSSDDKCQEFETNVRSHGPLFDFSDPACQDGLNSSTSTLEFDTSLSVFGVNIQFPSLGLGVNVLSDTGELEGFQGAELKMYQLTYTFNY